MTSGSKLSDSWDELNVWVRAGLLFLAAACLSLLVVFAAASFPDQALGFAGTWLMLYRLAIRGRFRPLVEVGTSVLSGFSLAFLAPLLPWSQKLTFPVFALLGGLLTSCSFPAQAAISSVCIGTALGASLWNLGICAAAPSAHVW